MTHARWGLISGAKGAGKSSTASRVAGLLAARGVTGGGVIQEALHEDGDRVAYRARQLGVPDDAVLLARRGAAPEGARADAVCSFCSFMFDDDAFAKAGAWIRDAARACEVVVIDEVSKLEASGGGHHDAIRDALGGRALVVLVVRADQLFAIVERFGLGDAVATLEVGDEGAVAPFVDALVQAARAEGSP